MTVPRKLTCSYALDERVDRELANLTQALYRCIQPFLGDRVTIPVRPRRGAVKGDTLPDPVQIWTIYCAVLVAGTADAALTSILHNLGREARALTRQVYECVTKAAYLRKHPRVARRELESETFRDLYMLQDLGYDKRSTRYRELKRECDLLAKKRPGLAKYVKDNRRKELPTVKAALGRKGKRSELAYTFHYRLASQTIHAGVLGIRDVFTDKGVKFDGREDNPNFALVFIAGYVLTFLYLECEVFGIDQKAKLVHFSDQLEQIKTRICAN